MEEAQGIDVVLFNSGCHKINANVNLSTSNPAQRRIKIAIQIDGKPQTIESASTNSVSCL